MAASLDDIYHATLRVEALLRELIAEIAGAPASEAEPAPISCEVCARVGHVVSNCPRCRGAGG